MSRRISMSSIYDLIDRICDAMTWVAVIVAGYILLDWFHDDNDPDGYA